MDFANKIIALRLQNYKKASEMGVIIRQSFKTSAAAYVGVLLGAAITLLLLPKFFSEEQIGIYRILIAIGATFTPFVQLGTAHIADRFFPMVRSGDRRHHNFLSFLLFYSALGVLFFVLLYVGFPDFWLSFFAKKAPEINRYYAIVPILVILLVYQGLFEAYIRCHLEVFASTFLKEVFFRFCMIALILAYAFSWLSFDDFVWAFVGNYALVVLLMSGYIAFVLKSFALGFDFSFFTASLRKEMRVFGFYIMLGGASSVIINQIDVLMLGGLLGAQQTGIYTISLFIGTVVEIPRRAIALIATPIIAKAWAENNLAEIKNVYEKSSINQFLIGAFIFLSIWLNIDLLFGLMPQGAIYAQGKYVVLFIGLTRLFDMLMGVNNEIILQSKYFRFNLLSNLFLAFFIVGSNYLLIPIYQLNGAAFATFLSIIAFNLLRFGFLWWRFRLQPFSHKTWQALLLVLAVYAVGLLVPLWSGGQSLASLLEIGLRTLLIGLLLGFFAFVGKMSPDANALLQGFWKRLKNKQPRA